ncbi:hypothetical protein VQ574_21440 (plasmid) [Stutzerimonas frequens]|uniref:hypothetical protein n=1 Tax=Stutzerimonas frequens TaxID=2968969 RepID=UPI002DBAE608|nr:hypothetical protein [Stutzerimonas frequens]WRW29291.1 hypothetical protein VQ574_21440 [Stutzerimonas frequens]
MPLQQNGETIITAHASKASKVNLKVFEAHTSVLLPLMILPVFPFWITLKISLICVLILILLERRGWTLGVALQRLRTRFAGSYRYRKTRQTLIRRIKID